jgi:hypothetical protein
VKPVPLDHGWKLAVKLSEEILPLFQTGLLFESSAARQVSAQKKPE